MDYVFGHEYLDGADIETVKSVGSDHTDFEGTVTVVRKFTDSDITDTFKVIRKIRTDEDEDGRCYDWYEIKDHYRYEDKFTPGIGQAIEPVIESVNDTQDALCEASEDFETRIADIENALCELTEE